VIEVISDEPVKSSLVAMPVKKRIESRRVNRQLIEPDIPGSNFERVHHHESILLPNEVKHGEVRERSPKVERLDGIE
jgi:hypothetical protein